jgi:peptidoglycan/LPS O-acetylase OafA/YrhL
MNVARDVRWPDSLWAAVTPPGPDLPLLEGAVDADVVVIGAGHNALVAATLLAPAAAWHRRVLRAGTLRAFGRYSYAAYILHVPLIALLVHWLAPLTFAVAWLSWHLYEKHFLKLKGRFPYQSAVRAADQSGIAGDPTRRAPIALAGRRVGTPQ